VIDVAQVLRGVPSFATFCSVEQLWALVESLRTDSTGFHVEVAGRSAQGRPIHYVRFGSGRVKALLVGFPHCDEPIGGLTIYSLLTLLRQGLPELADADVEWHVVPCIDPDGALLNEGWSLKSFTLGNYMRHFHKQQLRDQVDCTFPIHYKKLAFERPTAEASVLKGLLERIRPDFYYSLHNAWAGGAFYFLSRPVAQRYHNELYQLLEHHRIPLQTSAPHRVWCAEWGAGIYEMFTMKKYYDALERTMPSPETALDSGESSWEYLAELNDEALCFVAELPYVRHPSDGSKTPTPEQLRYLKLRVDAENKFLACALMEEWERVHDQLDRDSPFYRKISYDIEYGKQRLHEGLPSWPQKTPDILLNPAYGGVATEGERFNVYLVDRFYALCHGYEFVRLLKASPQTSPIAKAIERLETLFDNALDELAKVIDFGAFEVINCRSLAQVQLGSGLIALNAVLEAQRWPS
jgi:hypothetical protein